VALVLGPDQLQMPLAEDQYPVGDFGPGGEHEPFRVCVGRRHQLHLIQVTGTDVCG
jgi:hypothetical protein